MRDQRLSELLDAVAARTAAPGGGSTAACTCALAAAVTEMAARFAGPELEPIGARAVELRERALELADRELHAYEPVLAALRLPREDPKREQRLRNARAQAAETPLALAVVAVEVAELAAGAVREGNHHLAGDAITGALLAEAACAAAARLVEINLAGDPGPGARAEAAELARRAGAAREAALAGA
ncbi:MAG: cyclodeaminase/cyclohydrolase family protein [Solirubrobacterales bacterium]|nr:cyclodeaminase/cyclohydrolase family protein [Solirubrobacterales bacterium]MBV9716303.1 cyclodeaminase/cyclohydrolase family protein [Solirubrobacterales bacterium]